MGPFAFLCLCVWVWGFLVPPLPFLCVLVLSIGIVTDVFIGKWYLLIRTHPIPPGSSGNLGILGIVLRNVFALRENHFHGFGNYWEVIFTHSYSPGHSREIREFGNSGNCPAKRLSCKAKSLPWAWELLGSDISTRQICVLVYNNAKVVGPC